MPIDYARELIAKTCRQRCFWLLAALLVLFVSIPFLEATPLGRVTLNIATLVVLIVAATVVSRGGGPTVIVTLLALPTAAFLFLAVMERQVQYQILSQAFGAAFFFAVTMYLLSYVFRRDVLTMDKLYGAATAFMLLGVLWSYLYNILLWAYPGCLTINGQPLANAPPSTLIYFSYASLTATGMSDVMPVHPVARILCAMEMITGVLFMAVLIARLAGSYPPRER